MAARFVAKHFGAAAAFGDSQKTRIRQFTARGVFAHTLSRLFRVALDIEQVVRDLKRLPKTTAIGVEGIKNLRPGPAGVLRLGNVNAHEQSRAKKCPGFTSVERFQIV
jgi:hypothetical protein